FADFHFPGADRFVESALNQGKLLIILDGLDEVGVNREFVTGQIISFCERDDQQADKNRLIVTCREYSYRTEDLSGVIKNVVRVEPFANHHMRVFLQGWPAYRGRPALGLYTMIQRDAQIRDICRNPLLLTILTGLYLEAKDFRFPTSRNLFYQSAVDELITKRQARREIKQKFEASDKLQVLQRVSLSRLETVQSDEDPEELTVEAIRDQVPKVFGKEIEFNEFIKELVEVNGIIKPSAEGIFTCAHRTIQEYFGAIEAGRIRTPKEVVYRFSNRPDLIEVLYFYCGMLNNLPQLGEIIETLTAEHRFLEAGRCLMNMSEPPSPRHVETVAGELRTQVGARDEAFKPALEILSSLAQRPGNAFATARAQFSKTIDALSGGDEVMGASALESVLATSPEAAMKVIPGLIKSESPRWQTAAVQLLKDIGTDEALDELVRLLNHDSSVIKAEAAKALSILMKTRAADLKDRASFLPERLDKTIWPLETVFPGRLAIPIAESLSGIGEAGNQAINCAIRAAQAVKTTLPPDDPKFLKSWKNVARDLKRKQYKAAMDKYVEGGGLLLTLAGLLFLNAVFVWGYWNDRAVIVEMSPTRVTHLPDFLMRTIEDNAESIAAKVAQIYPPNAGGLWRILPWNWSVEPLIADPATEEAYQRLTRSRQLKDPYAGADEAKSLIDPSPFSGISLRPLQDAVTTLHRMTPSPPSRNFLILRPSGAGFLLPVVTLFAVVFLVFEWKGIGAWANPVDSIHSKSFSDFIRIRLFLGNSGSFIVTIVIYYFVIFVSGNYLLKLLTIVLICLPVLTGRALKSLTWPRNSLLSVVGSVSETGRKETPSSRPRRWGTAAA
ncbi:MAG TPA: HEAT repeat domain-containing protein, partial [Pyrinomonadaceae bacterium]